MMKNNSENKTKKKGNRQAKEQVSPYIFKKKKTCNFCFL